MKKIIFFILLFFSFNALTFAQVREDDEGDVKEVKDNFYQKYLKGKLYTGGGAGLAFGTFTNISLNPIIGYKVNNRLKTGIGINYQYINNRFYNVSYSVYGGRAFVNYFIIPQAYLIGEYSLMNIEYFYRSSWERGWFPALLGGAGYSQRLGMNSSYNLEVLWNILQSPVYPINYPIIRIGINIGL